MPKGIDVAKQQFLSMRVLPPVYAVEGIVVLRLAVEEAKRFLTPVQYEHAVDLVKRTRDFNNPTDFCDLDIRSVQNIHEIRDKGGVLGRINLRIFFAYRKRRIIVLGAIKKEDEGKTPEHIIIRMQNRLDALV